AAAWYGIGLVTDNLARFAPPAALIQPGAQVVSAGGMGLAVTVCVLAWLARREAMGLLLAATLAPILVGVRALAAGLLVALDLATLAEVADVGLGLLALGCLVWAASETLLGAVPARSSRSAQADLFRRVVNVTALVAF